MDDITNTNTVMLAVMFRNTYGTPAWQAVADEINRRDAERAALRAEVEQLKVKLQTANSDYDKLMADARSISRVREQLERDLGLD